MSQINPARFFLNRDVGKRESKPASSLSEQPLAFHQRLPGYVPTPLIDAPEVARTLEIGQLLIKDESRRLGLPAFKILGASWAVYRALESRLGRSLEPWRTMDELREKLVSLRPLTLATATDGNHGRAVAHVAALFGFEAQIYVPAGTASARIDSIAGEGARVVVVDGTYDDAVARAAEDANESCLVVSDTSWPGYEEIPRWVTEGYSTIMSEIDDELSSEGRASARPGGAEARPSGFTHKTIPDLIAIQFGVGALAAAVVRHYQQTKFDTPPKILSVEPLRAACGLASMEAGEIVTVPGPHDSIMAGLNCGRPSMVAWPIVSRGIDAFIAIPDEQAREAMRALARAGIVAGETGAAGLAGLFELLNGPESARHREALGIDENMRALVIVTEGATDPANYHQIVTSAT